ncbi:MAG TPA: alpha/beta hydrolase [Acidimicrobiales bacterium]|nr:alpha/beta hydrolase [Acidimicrobiales bacterium]
MEQVEVDGRRIALERRGSGPPLVLLHGLPGDSRMWVRQLDSLSDSFTVVAWDAPGCGRSSDLTEGAGTTDVARCLVGVIEQLDLGSPHVVGLSWGVGIALEAYRLAPEVPRSLVLASGYAGWKGSLPAEMFEPRLEAYLRASRTPKEERVRAWGPGFFSPSASQALIDEMLVMAADFHPEPLASYARSFAETDLREVLPTIAVPTLVLQAGADDRAPAFVGEAMAAAIEGARFEVLDGVGHVSNMEAPAAFDEAVRRFLSSLA